MSGPRGKRECCERRVEMLPGRPERLWNFGCLLSKRESQI